MADTAATAPATPPHGATAALVLADGTVFWGAGIGAAGIKDMGKAMAALRAKYAGRMDFAKASGVLRQKLGG